MTPTPTPPPTTTPTPYFWPTPTARPTDDTYQLTMPAVNPILVQGAEETVQVYNLANQYELMDNFITLILIVMIIGAAIRFWWKMRRLGGQNYV
jgi:hypothetical protein